MDFEHILNKDVPIPPLSPVHPPPAVTPSTEKRARTKRPRIPSPPPPPSLHIPVRGKRVAKRPAAYFPDATGPTCAFCAIPGTQRECEGTLLGPFRWPGKLGDRGKTFYAHRNCAVWSPEVWESDKSGDLQNVTQALARARRMKCIYCNSLGASLSCMFQSTACCKPMHFRCALLDGASLRDGFHTLCRRHAHHHANSASVHVFVDKTPVPEALLLPGTGCKHCTHDTFDFTKGAILTCANCDSREHSKCVWPDLEKDALLSALSYRGEFLCKKCMRCVSCSNSIDHDVYNFNPSQLFNVSSESAVGAPEMRDPDCDTVMCLSCKHFAIHVNCLPEGSTPTSWRCDSCLICRHCGVYGIPRAEWYERYEACHACAMAIQEDGVVCPVCRKVYREGENIPMIQCDYCDRWLHAIDCCKMTKEQFKSLEKSDSKTKYRCPICIDEKKARDQERKRLKHSASRLLTNGSRAECTRSLDVSILIKRLQDCQENIAFHSVRKMSACDDTFEQVFKELAPGTELCRLCCSSGSVDGFKFCADCGECYHPFCLNVRTGSLREITKTAMLASGKEVGTAGMPGADNAPWFCINCANSTNLSTGKATSSPIGILSKATDATKPVERYRHQVVHATPPEHINGLNGVKVQNGMNGLYGRRRMKKPNGINRICLDNTMNGSVVRTIWNNISSGGWTAPEKPLTGVTWDDDRTCDLCDEKESSLLGRLIPWASCSAADASHSWIHIACAIWSTGISLHGTQPFDVLLGPRRSLLNTAKRTKCTICGSFGASLKCSAQGCPAVFHFRCAVQQNAGSIMNFINEVLGRASAGTEDDMSQGINLVNIQSVQIICHEHSMMEDVAKYSRLLKKSHQMINVQRKVLLHDIQGYTKDLEPPRKKQLSSDRLLSLRTGSLSVLRFGKLMPEVNSFIVNGCLIPLGYCSTRRFWSMVRPGQRCLYFFEVCGFIETGPVFVIRCSDCAEEKIEAKDPEVAWQYVVDRIMKLRHRFLGKEYAIRPIRTTGLEAFGLKKCIPVVTHIESLPMAAMFAGRYNLKRVAAHRNDDIRFYNTLASNYRPANATENRSGSARTEGYTTKRILKKQKTECEVKLPISDNVMTGAAFQLEVAREVYKLTNRAQPQVRSSKKLVLESLGGLRNTIVRTMPKVIEERSRTSKATSSSSHVSQHRWIATTSLQRTKILRSSIEGLGVFATEDIRAGEMIIEYVGEIIRPSLSDKREIEYREKGIGCYMFEVEPGVIVDATMCGNAARYINHSCAPNCYSKTVTLENDRRVIVIFSKRKIQRGEELSYDYQFPFDESDRVHCGCGAPQCRGWMN